MSRKTSDDAPATDEVEEAQADYYADFEQGQQYVPIGERGK